MIIGFLAEAIISTEKNELLFNSLRDRRPRRDTISYICGFSRGGLDVSA